MQRRVGDAVDEPLERMVDVRLAHARDAPGAPGRQATTDERGDQRRDVRIEHRLHLARHAGHEVEPRALERHAEAGRLPGGVVEHLRPRRHPHLAQIIRRQARAALGKARAHLLLVHRVDDRPDPDQARRHVDGAIVVGGTEPARADDHVGPPRRLAQRRRHIGGIVGDRGAPAHVRAECGKSFR